MKLMMDCFDEISLQQINPLRSTCLALFLPCHLRSVFMLNSSSAWRVNNNRAYNPWVSFVLNRNLDKFQRHCTDLALREKKLLEVWNQLSLTCLLARTQMHNLLKERKAKGETSDRDQTILSAMLSEDDDGSTMPLSRVVDNIKTFLYADTKRVTYAGLSLMSLTNIGLPAMIQRPLCFHLRWR